MNNNILAVVDGREITQSDLYELVQSIGQNAMQFQSAEGQKQLVNELVMQELLYSDALAHKLNEEEEFKVAVERMTRSLLKQFAMSKLLQSVTVTDDEVKAYFEAHKALFKKQPSAMANHILVSTEEEALNIAKEIKDGLAFAEAAKKYSSCPSSAQGGNLGEFGPGQMVPEFDQAVFSMPIGEVSEPVKTQFGYHLIEVVKRTEALEADFEEVKAQVKEQCLMQKRQLAYVQKREELEKVYNVEVK